MVLTGSSGLEEFSASQELLQFSNLLYMATLVCFAEAFHWPPVVSQRNCSKYRCMFRVFLGGSKFSVLLHCYLRPPSLCYIFFLLKTLYSHVLLHNVSINSGPHIQWWSHKVTMDYKQKVCLSC